MATHIKTDLHSSISISLVTGDKRQQVVRQRKKLNPSDILYYPNPLDKRCILLIRLTNIFNYPNPLG